MTPLDLFAPEDVATQVRESAQEATFAPAEPQHPHVFAVGDRATVWTSTNNGPLAPVVIVIVERVPDSPRGRLRTNNQEQWRTLKATPGTWTRWDAYHDQDELRPFAPGDEEAVRLSELRNRLAWARKNVEQGVRNVRDAREEAAHAREVVKLKDARLAEMRVRQGELEAEADAIALEIDAAEKGGEL